MEVKIITSVTLIAGLLLAGCMTTESSGPVVQHQMNIIAGGVGQDIPGRVYEEYGQDTTCWFHQTGISGEHGSACPDDTGFPHEGQVCPAFKWSVQFRNDHPTDSSEEKYGVPYNASLVYALQEWRAQKQELRFYWVRYSDTGCKFTDNEVVYCAELVTLSKEESRDHGCIHAMHRTFPGLDSSWLQGLDYTGDKNMKSADGVNGA